MFSSPYHRPPHPYGFSISTFSSDVLYISEGSFAAVLFSLNKAHLRCNWPPQKSSPFALWLDLLLQLRSSGKPKYMKYSGLPESSAGTKSLHQTGKKQLSCGCPTNINGGQNFMGIMGIQNMVLMTAFPCSLRVSVRCW